MMAKPKPKALSQEEKIKKRMKKQFDDVDKKADLISGKTTPDGSLYKNKKNLKDAKTKTSDFDDFIKTMEGLTYDKAFSKINITRLTKGQTTNK